MFPRACWVRNPANSRHAMGISRRSTRPGCKGATRGKAQTRQREEFAFGAPANICAHFPFCPYTALRSSRDRSEWYGRENGCYILYSPFGRLPNPDRAESPEGERPKPGLIAGAPPHVIRFPSEIFLGMISKKSSLVSCREYPPADPRTLCLPQFWIHLPTPSVRLFRGDYRILPTQNG